MKQKLLKLGDSKALILTNEMIDLLSIKDDVDISVEVGQIVITAPTMTNNRLNFDEAKDATFIQYDEAMKRLAKNM